MRDRAYLVRDLRVARMYLFGVAHVVLRHGEIGRRWR